MRTDINVTLIARRFSATSPAEGAADLGRLILRELAAGRRVSPPALAEELGWTEARVLGVLEGSPGTEYDENGGIIGYGLSLRETPHVCEIDGHRLYAWCALDALMFPAWLGVAVRVTSICAFTGVPIRLTATPEGVQRVEPAGAMLSLVSPDAATDIRRGFCCHVQFFASATAAEEWRAGREHVTVVSVLEGFAVGQDLMRRIFGTSDSENASDSLQASRRSTS